MHYAEEYKWTLEVLFGLAAEDKSKSLKQVDKGGDYVGKNPHLRIPNTEYCWNIMKIYFKHKKLLVNFNQGHSEYHLNEHNNAPKYKIELWHVAWFAEGAGSDSPSSACSE